MRLFVALFLPDAVATHLDRRVRLLRDTERDGQRSMLRWVQAGQRHITLAFYGDTPGDAVDSLAADLAQPPAAAGALTLRLRGSGTFGSRVLWAGVAERRRTGWNDRAEGLTSLMTYCNETGARHIPDLQPRAPADLRPHLTLARARDPRSSWRALKDAAAALDDYEGPAWTVTGADLVRSEPGKGQGGSARYTTLGVVPFAD